MHPRSLTRLFALALAATILPAHSCKDNLGQGGPPAALVFRVSVQKDGVQAEGASVTPWISGDGRSASGTGKIPCPLR